MLLGVVQAWLDWLTQSAGCPIGPGLDEHLDEDRLARLLSGDTEVEFEVPAAAVRAVAAKLETSALGADRAAEAPPDPRRREAGRATVGSVRVPADRRRLAEAIAQLAAGRTGFAGYLNSLSTTEAVAEAAAALSGSGELCLVLADLPPWEVEEAKKSLAARSDPRTGPPRRGLIWVLGLSLTVAILAALTAWYLMRPR